LFAFAKVCFFLNQWYYLDSLFFLYICIMNHNRNTILRPNIIKEIAYSLNVGSTCYVHKGTHEVTTINSAVAREAEEQEAADSLQETIEHMEAKTDLYLKIEQMPSQTQIQMMRDFIEEIPEPELGRELTNALNRKNPIRNFTQVINSNEGLGQHWHNFKMEEYQRWVSNFIIDAYNY
jgi:Uncharacterised protein family (UPF0158)